MPLIVPKGVAGKSVIAVILCTKARNQISKPNTTYSGPVLLDIDSVKRLLTEEIIKFNSFGEYTQCSPLKNTYFAYLTINSGSMYKRCYFGMLLWSSH